MADSRIKDLADEILSNEIAALLNTLYLAVDDTSFTDAQKILLKSILTEDIVSANTNNYQALTPKGFYDSVMTTARRGIGMLALDADVTAKTGTGLLNSVHQTLMQAQWFKDWCVATNGVPAFYACTASPIVAGGALAYNVVWAGVGIANQRIVISPPFANGVGIYRAHVSAIICRVYGQLPVYGHARSLDSLVTEVSEVIAGTHYISVSANGAALNYYVTGNYNNAQMSATVLLLLKD